MTCGCQDNVGQPVRYDFNSLYQTNENVLTICPTCYNTFTFTFPCGLLAPGETLADTPMCQVNIVQVDNCLIQQCTGRGTVAIPCSETSITCPIPMFAVTAEYIKLEIISRIPVQTGPNQPPITRTCSPQTRSVGLGTTYDQLIVACYKCDQPTTCTLDVADVLCTVEVRGQGHNRRVFVTVSFRIVCLT